MFSFYIKDFETNLSGNATISKKIEIDENLICFLIIDSNNKKIITPLLNKIVDYIIDNITLKDTYNKFSVALENINFFIKSLKTENDEINLIITILEKNNMHFSKIWKSSCFLINSKNKFIEISDKTETNKTFDFVSSWKLTSNEKVILSSVDLSQILTQSDIEEIVSLDENENIINTICDILNEEKIERNIWIVSIKYENIYETKEVWQKFEKLKNIFYKSLDNNFSKKIIALYMILCEKIETKWKIVKNIVFLSGIVLSTFFLFLIISSILSKSIENSKTVEYKNDLIQAREFIRLANQNLANEEAFELNIKKAEELVEKVSQEKLFLNDVENINDDISIIKKQFNWVEIFDENINNMIFKWNFKDWIKLLEINKKLYVIWKISIYGPIISGQDIKNNIFKELEMDDEFIDATNVGDDIILTTKKARVIKFNKTGKFGYINVIDQKTWQWSPIVESYNGNLYMTNKDSNQIYKHSPSSWGWTSGVPYLNDADSKNIGKILSIWIDGWIYILKNDLSILKFFSSPKYRIESLMLNKLPENYKQENSKINLVIRNNLTFIYMYLNNKIWIFEPNTKVFTNTKSLIYRWQIEWKNKVILGFYIPRDWEINILTETWIYKVLFEIKDEKLIIR